MSEEFVINIFSQTDSQTGYASHLNTHHVSFFVCIKQLESDECLANIHIKRFRSPQFVKIRTGEYGQSTIYYNAIIYDKYNILVKKGGFSSISDKLKNGGKAMFCMLLKKLLRDNILDLEDIILLKISDDDDDDEDKIIRHYKKMGWEKLNDEMMIGKVKDVYSMCDAAYYSQRIRNVLESI